MHNEEALREVAQEEGLSSARAYEQMDLFSLRQSVAKPFPLFLKGSRLFLRFA